MAGIKNNHKQGRGQLFKFAGGTYLERTSRPIYALAYLFVFIVCYEVGTLRINPEILDQSLSGMRIVVSFVWVQSLLRYLHFSQKMTWIAAPLVVVVILAACQIVSRTKWQVRVKDFLPTTCECVLFAIPLIVLTLVLNRLVSTAERTYTDVSVVSAAADRSGAGIACSSTVVPAAVKGGQNRIVPQTGRYLPAGAVSGAASGNTRLFADVVIGIGAGIYEELIFRLILITVLMLFFQDILVLPRRTAIIISVFIAAFLFSAHHHIFFAYGQFHRGEPFTVVKFFFRALAGVYFAMIFAVRGFAVTAGSHVFYNIMAALINAANGPE